MIITYQKNNSINKISDILKEASPKSILLVRGNASYSSSGASAALEPILKPYNVTEKYGFHKSPALEDIEDTIKIIKDNNIDFILGIGGGTVMDVAKAAAILYKEKSPLADYITGKIKPESRDLKTLLIPTTAGTGAEITPFSVIYIGKTKYSLVHPSMSPDHVILAPELTYSLTPKITAETGADALAQAIEAFWSVNATDESKQFSREAIPLVMKNLNKAVNSPDPENRKAMLYASHLAGKAISIAKTTAAHALSYPMTAYHNVPHGHAVMLTLPYFFPINEKATQQTIQDNIELQYVKETFDELLSIMQASNGTQARDKLAALMKDIHLETKLSQLAIKESDLQNIVDNGFNPQRVKNNPVKITEEIIWGILKGIY